MFKRLKSYRALPRSQRHEVRHQLQRKRSKQLKPKWPRLQQVQVPAQAGASMSSRLTPDPDCPLSSVTRVPAMTPSGQHSAKWRRCQRETCLRVTFPAAQGARGFPWQRERALAAAQCPSKPPRRAAGVAPKMGADGHRPVFEPTAFWGEPQPPKAHPHPSSQVSPMKGYLQNWESMEP